MEEQYSPLAAEGESRQGSSRNLLRLAVIAVAVVVNVIGGSIAAGRRDLGEPADFVPPIAFNGDVLVSSRRTYNPIITGAAASVLLLVAEIIPRSFQYRVDLALRAVSAALTVASVGPLVVHAWYLSEIVGGEDEEIAGDALQITGMCVAWLAVALIPGLIAMLENLGEFVQFPRGLGGVILAVLVMTGAIVGFATEEVVTELYELFLSFGVTSLLVAIVGLFGWILMQNRWAQLLAIFLGTKAFLVMFPQTFYVKFEDCDTDKAQCEVTFALQGLGCGLFVLWIAVFGPEDEAPASSVVQKAVSSLGIVLTAVGAGLMGNHTQGEMKTADLVLLVVSALVSFLAFFCPLQLFNKRHVAIGFAGATATFLYVPSLILAARGMDKGDEGKGAAGNALAAAGLMLVWLPYMDITKFSKFGERPLHHLVDAAIFLMFVVAAIILSVWVSDGEMSGGEIFIATIVSHFLGGCIFVAAVFNLYGTGIWGVFFALIVNATNQALSGEIMVESAESVQIFIPRLHDGEYTAAYALFWVAEVLAVMRLSLEFTAEATDGK